MHDVAPRAQDKEGSEKTSTHHGIVSSGSPTEEGIALNSKTFDSSGEDSDCGSDGLDTDVELGKGDNCIPTKDDDAIRLDEYSRKENPADDGLRHRHPRPRSKSFDAADASDTCNIDKSYMFSFRMPVSTNATSDESGPSTGCLRSTSRSHKPPTDYNFVLDDYVEYSDGTKIPRLRGRDVGKLISAIHSSHPAVLCVVLIVSCFLTYSISNHAPYLRADVAQAVVVTLVLATFPEVAASAGAGAFAGMAGTGAVPHYGWLALLAVLTSAVWWTFHRFKLLVGCSGRLGTCAFLGMNATVAVFGMPSGAVPWSFYADTTRLWSERLEILPSVLTVAASTFLSVVGGGVRLKAKIPLNPVQAPTTIALLCMLVMEPTGYIYTEQIDAGFAVGSFVAMASDQYLSSILDFGGAGFVAGLWSLFLDPFFLEFGGKKGFTSFCGFVTYVTISKVVSWGFPTKEK